ncbi:flagellin [Nitratireductor soli]|uniref:flagellin N-terminal helical domain-containing protein n=1 Tax=Nitratireductor soli TaxID=1670619 RepID=UPI00065E6123|nr:flagellin [Nitratireductor soli]
MSSILTNASAMTALQTLTMTNKNLAQTQSRIATGMKVAEASDNAAYWSIATTMRSDNKANSVVLDGLGLGAGKVDTAYTAIKDSIDVVDQIKQQVLSAKTASPADRAKIQDAIKAYQAHLSDSVGNASYAGSNLLETDPAGAANLSIVSSYNRDAAGVVTTGEIAVSLTNIRLLDSTGGNTGILDTLWTGATNAAVQGMNVLNLDVTDATLDDAAFDELLTGIETVAKGLATGASELGAAKTRIDLQSNFIKSLSDAMDRGVGQLVDADMNEESTRLQALQVQQQLGIQALSIANSNTQQILSLFR